MWRHCNFLNRIYVFYSSALQTAGIVAFILIGWALTDPSIASQLTQHETYSYIGLCVLIGVAILTLIIAFLGCCGALKESQCMLVTVSASKETANTFWCSKPEQSIRKKDFTNKSMFLSHFSVLLLFAGRFGCRNCNWRLCISISR